ncbi:acyl-CoA thioesterase [Solibacillus sp. FSL H8-0538]|uniref:acyl-CoA thioesterase n=1 Tax=Solibacillus sp. FSL H8-0538 TaxID=2921400 RepID=UPI0030F7C4BC
MFISEKQVEIRYAETDQMGIVYHANYLIWCEIGRTQFVKDIGYDYAKLEADGYLSPVMDFSIQYKAAMHYGQTATVRTWVESHSKLRTSYGYEVLHEDGTVAAKATSLHIIVKKENLRPVALSKIDPVWDAKYTKAARNKE